MAVDDLYAPEIAAAARDWVAPPVARPRTSRLLLESSSAAAAPRWEVESARGQQSEAPVRAAADGVAGTAGAGRRDIDLSVLTMPFLGM